MRVLGRPYGPKLHNGLLNRYEGTNITEENVVNHTRTQLIDALIEFGINNDIGPVNKTDGVQTWPLALRIFVLQ